MPVCDQCLDLHAADAPDCPARLLGTTVAGRYRIQEMIGAGAMSAVFRAEHLGLHSAVALKVLRRKFVHDAASVERLMREARGTAVVRHPNVVEVHDAGVDGNGTPYLEMELLRGRPVDALTRSGPLDVEQALSIARGALDGLAAAHARGLVHRDVKPANLFLAQEAGGETVKVLDFGFAKLDNAQSLTLPGQRLGTPSFMSPEQLSDPGSVDARADVYSLGATLFHLLTGSVVVDGDAIALVFARIMKGDIERHPRALRPELPRWLDAVVARALEHEASRRFQSAREMRAALSEGFDDTLGAVPAGDVPGDEWALATTMAAPAARLPPLPTPVRAAAREPVRAAALPEAAPAPSRRWLGQAGMALGALAVLVLVGLLAYVVGSRVQ